MAAVPVYHILQLEDTFICSNQNQLFCASESMERSRSFLFVIFCYLEARKNLVFASICHSRRQGHSTMTPSTISKDARAGRLSALYDRHDDVVSCFSMANGVTIGGRSALAQALIFYYFDLNVLQHHYFTDLIHPQHKLIIKKLNEQ
jgi:hypothetical protein